MRTTMMREGFVDSERVNKLDYDEECFYHRLLLKCDDAGRFDGRIQILRSELFPLGYKTHSDPVVRGVDGAQREELVLRYDIHEKPYIQVTNWQKRFNTEMSHYPGPDGTFEIRHVQMETEKGMRLFIDTSIRHADLARIVVDPSPTPPPPIKDDAGDDGKVIRYADGVGTPSRHHPDSIVKEESKEAYKRHPALEILHRTASLAYLDVAQYEACIEARSPYLLLEPAARELVRRARIDPPQPKDVASWVDKQLMYFQKDNPQMIERRAKEHQHLMTEKKNLIKTLREIDPRNSGDSDLCDRMEREFREEFGEVELASAVREARDLPA